MSSDDIESTERKLVEEYVSSGKLMQVATLAADGQPEVCNVWYDPHFRPDLLRFISRHTRNHSENIRARPGVAGSIVAIPLVGLGQTARAVTFRGQATELLTIGVDTEARSFIGRWPAAESAIDPDALARNETTSRLYEIRVTEWILFDEENFPEQPRRVVGAFSGEG
jgi:hypothetical protein